MRLLSYLICCPRVTRGLRILCEREFARRCRRNRSTGPGVWCACPGSTIQQPEKYSKSSLCVSLRILNAKLGLKGVFNFVRFYERPYFFFFFFLRNQISFWLAWGSKVSSSIHIWCSRDERKTDIHSLSVCLSLELTAAMRGTQKSSGRPSWSAENFVSCR